jgi:hypothetical protein
VGRRVPNDLDRAGRTVGVVRLSKEIGQPQTEVLCDPLEPAQIAGPGIKCVFGAVTEHGGRPFVVVHASTLLVSRVRSPASA